jgi:hypothetical protein
MLVVYEPPKAAQSGSVGMAEGVRAIGWRELFSG